MKMLQNWGMNQDKSAARVCRQGDSIGPGYVLQLLLIEKSQNCLKQNNHLNLEKKNHRFGILRILVIF
jgi:hypothetical protein